MSKPLYKKDEMPADIANHPVDPASHSGRSGNVDSFDSWLKVTTGDIRNTVSDLVGNAADYLATPIQDLYSGKPDLEAQGDPKAPYDGPYWDGIHRGAAPQEINYLNADLAKAYGMDASTAYQEALSNTSYQRAVADLQAAGLNPILAAGKAGGADGVYSSQVVGDPLAGHSGGAKNVKADQHSMYKVLSNVFGVIGAGIGAFTGKNVRSAYLGSKVASGIGGSLGNLIDMM